MVLNSNNSFIRLWPALTHSVQLSGKQAKHALVGVVILSMLTACGGGGGSSSRDAGPPPTGSVELTVVDSFDGPVSGASVSISSGTTTRSGTTDDLGVSTVTGVAAGSATVTTTATGFVEGTSSVTVTADQQASTSITLERVTEPAAGLFTTQLTQQLSQTDGQTLTFAIEVLVVDDDSASVSAIETLTAADFTLLPCVNSDPNEVECLRGDLTQPDIGYTVVSATPAGFQLTAGQAATPYAATIMIDQSGSIRNSDPSDARLFATKVFLNNLGGNDFASVSAFAEERNAAAPALIADEPVTRLTDFIQSNAAASVFDQIDELAQQEGGDTPLYTGLVQELEYTAANAPNDGIDRRSAVVLFTDGDDSICTANISPPCGLEESIQRAVDLDVDIFTVGLGADIDVDVLRRLAEGGNGFYLFAENAQQLFPIYRSLGELLSRTLSTYQMEWTIRADQANTYQTGQTILGTLRIDTGSNQIDLPIRLFLTTT